MGSNYTEQNTERARAAEQASSAGMATRQLTPNVTLPATAVRRNNIAAMALIAVGVMMFLGRLLPDRDALTGGMILLTIASCFFFFSFWKRIYGLLIPASILAGLSLGIPFADATNGVSVLWGLALGFLTIFLVGTAMFQKRSSWPIYPAIPLFAVGVIVAIANAPAIFVGGMIWLPLLLIGAGLYLFRSRQVSSS
jgi:hypothetical protein